LRKFVYSSAIWQIALLSQTFHNLFIFHSQAALRIKEKHRTKGGMMKNYIISQFGRPRGLVGRLVGRIMARENRERNNWAVSLLNVQPADRILEIGFGPGLALQQISKQAKAGFVAGVDISAVMMSQASKRNSAAIQDGRMQLYQGTVGSLPFEDDRFDKVLVVNSVHHWPDAMAGLQEVLRVLKPDGTAVFVEQPHGVAGEDAETAVRSRLGKQIETAGFGHIETQIRPINGKVVVAFLTAP
jgi:SAM-dependent methyltransferase